MAINVYNFVQYNGGFLSDIFLLTQAPIFIWFQYYNTNNIIVYYYNKLPSVLLCLEALHGD